MCIDAEKLKEHKEKCVIDNFEKVENAPEIESSHMQNHTGEKPFLFFDCKEGCESDEELHASACSQKKQSNEPFNEGLKCSECEYEATSKAELNLHEKKHTGESPERIIDQAFDTIIKSPMANLFGAAVNVLSGPKIILGTSAQQ